MFTEQFPESHIELLLDSAGLRGVKLEEHPELGQGAQAALVRRYGVDVWVILTPLPPNDTSPVYYGTVLSLRVVIGFLPRAGVSALFRKLLSLNLVMYRARFAFSEKDNSVCLVEWLRYPANIMIMSVSLAPTLDAIVAAYHEHAPELIKEFGLLQEPPSVPVDPTI